MPRRSGSEETRGPGFWARSELGRLAELVRGLAQKPVPAGASWAYTMGSLALFYFSLQFITGILLLVLYVPDSGRAFASVQTIEHRAELGWLVRQVHSWGASFIVLALIFHVLKVLWYGTYKRPREFTWFAGCLLLALTLGFCFSGYLLPWNQLAYWATRVGVDAVDSVPILGPPLKRLLCGGNEVGGHTLGRFFALHVVVLPALLLALVSYHLYLVVRKGSAPHRMRVDEELELGSAQALALQGAEPFFPRQLYRDLIACTLGFALLVTAAVFWPWELGEPASLETPEGIKPEWYFLPVYQFLKYFDHETMPFLARWEVDPAFFGVLAIGCLSLAFFFLPVLDRGRERRLRRRPFFAIVAFAALVAVLGLGVLGYLSEREVTLFGRTYRFTAKGVPVPVEARESGAAKEGAPGSTGEGEESGGGVKDSSRAEPQGDSGEGSETPGGGAGGAGLAAKRPDGLEWGGTCSGCHQEERDEWIGSVHRRAGVECADCHGGIDTPPGERLLALLESAVKEGDEDAWPEDVETPEARRLYLYAHQGIRVNRRGEPARPPASEIPAFCGERCHANVYRVFSPRHLEESPSRHCVKCHENHDVKPAGVELYERKGYTDASDPRTAPFQEIRGILEGLEARAAAVRRRLEELKEIAYPLKEFEDEMSSIERRLGELHPLVHSLDPGTVRKGTAEVEGSEALEEALADLERAIDAVFAARSGRWRAAVIVWAGALAVVALLLWGLRRARRSGEEERGVAPEAALAELDTETLAGTEGGLEARERETPLGAEGEEDRPGGGEDAAGRPAD